MADETDPSETLPVTVDVLVRAGIDAPRVLGSVTFAVTPTRIRAFNGTTVKMHVDHQELAGLVAEQLRDIADDLDGDES